MGWKRVITREAAYEWRMFGQDKFEVRKLEEEKPFLLITTEGLIISALHEHEREMEDS